MKKSRICKTMMFVWCQAMLMSFGGTCLPDNILADTAGQIVNGLIVGGFDMLVAGSGLPI